MMTEAQRQTAFNSVGLIHKICGLRKRLTELFPDAEINDVTRKQILERTLGKKLLGNCVYHVTIKKQGAEHLIEAEKVCAAIERYNEKIPIESTLHIGFARTKFYVKVY